MLMQTELLPKSKIMLYPNTIKVIFVVNEGDLFKFWLLGGHLIRANRFEGVTSPEWRRTLNYEKRWGIVEKPLHTPKNGFKVNRRNEAHGRSLFGEKHFGPKHVHIKSSETNRWLNIWRKDMGRRGKDVLQKLQVKTNGALPQQNIRQRTERPGPLQGRVPSGILMRTAMNQSNTGHSQRQQ